MIDHCLAGLRGIREHRGMSAEEAASIIEVAVSSYRRYETGARRIYLDKATMLAKALRCSVDDLTRYRSADELLMHLGPAAAAGEQQAPGTVVDAAEALQGWDIT